MSGDTDPDASNKLDVTVNNCAGSLYGMLLESKYGKSKVWLYANDALRIGMLVGIQ